jgi:prophage antirepressor-like protein
MLHSLAPYKDYGVSGIGAILSNKRPPHAKELEIPWIMGAVVPHLRRQGVYEFYPKPMINNLMSNNPDTKRGDSP